MGPEIRLGERAFEIVMARQMVKGEFETTWFQRHRKRAKLGDIAPPPKYRSADFLSNGYWRLRGALDVPKERFVSYPHCSRENDPMLVVGWAGWDPLK